MKIQGRTACALLGCVLGAAGMSMIGAMPAEDATAKYQLGQAFQPWGGKNLLPIIDQQTGHLWVWQINPDANGVSWKLQDIGDIPHKNP